MYFVHALGDQDHIWAADTPIDSSQPNQIKPQFDPATPAGNYSLELGVYAPPGGYRLGVFDAPHQDAGDHIFLGPIRVSQLHLGEYQRASI